MVVRNALSKEKRDELLRRACDRSVPVEVVSAQGGKVRRHRSRFLRLVVDAGGVHVVIEGPMEEGRAVTYHEGETIDVQFQQGGERYGFQTEVESRGRERLNETTEVPALVCGYPEALETRQRRAHYRVPLSVTDPCTVTFRERLGVEDEGPREETNLYSAVVRDISVGGLALHCTQRLPRTMRIGSEMHVWFQLPAGEEHMHLRAVMRNERRVMSGEGRVLGVEFQETAKTVRGRRALDEIQRFVVARQREILKKVKSL